MVRTKSVLQLQPSAAGSRVTESRSGSNLRRILHISAGRWCDHFLMQISMYIHSFTFVNFSFLDAKERVQAVENWITTDKTICSNCQLGECT